VPVAYHSIENGGKILEIFMAIYQNVQIKRRDFIPLNRFTIGRKKCKYHNKSIVM
jgi:hypothetical protein